MGGLKSLHMTLLSMLVIQLKNMHHECPRMAIHPEPREDQRLQEFMEEMTAEVKELDAEEGAELMFFGDSITEAWRGSDMGSYSPRADDAPDIFQKYFSHKYRSQVFAVGGDQISNLHWRLENGNLPTRHQPAVAVVMIGINNLLIANGCWPGNATALIDNANVAAFRIIVLLEMLLRKLPSTQVLLLGVLPAGDWTDETSTTRWPNALTQPIQTTNFWLSKAAEAAERLTYLDCGPDFLLEHEISRELQSDGLHPSHKGMETLAACLAGPIDSLMEKQAELEATRPRGEARHFVTLRQHVRHSGVSGVVFPEASGPVHS